MNIQQLRYFCIVAQLENMSKAASFLSIAQPALSKSIKNLEQSIDLDLFDRHGKSISLNKNGYEFLKKANNILELVDETLSKMNDYANTNIQIIRILIQAGQGVIPKFLYEFSKLYPNIKFEIHQNPSSKNNEQDFHISIKSSLYKNKAQNSLILLEEEIMLGVAKAHPLAYNESINLADLANENFISIKSGETFRNITDSFCKSVGFIPNINFECDTPEVAFKLLELGAGIGFIAHKTWGLVHQDTIKLLKINDLKATRFIELTYFNHESSSNKLNTLIKFLQNSFSTL